MITTVGINLMRDLLCGESTASITNAGLGTNDTPPAEENTGLNANVNLGTVDTDLAITYATTDRQVLFEYTLPSTAANGNTYTEFGLNNGAILFNRQTFYDLVKDASKEINISLVIRVIPE